MRKSIVALLFLLFAYILPMEGKTHSVVIYFPINSSYVKTYMGNNEQILPLLVDSIDTFVKNPSYRINSIKISGATCLEGTELYNDWMAERRINSVVNYIRKFTTLPDSICILENKGRDWETLIRLIEKDKDVPQVSSVLSLLYDIKEDPSQSVRLENTLQEIMYLNDSVVYNYFNDNFYPLLRAVYVNIDYDTNVTDEYQKESLSVVVSDDKKNVFDSTIVHYKSVDMIIESEDVVVEPIDVSVEQVDTIVESMSSFFEMEVVDDTDVESRSTRRCSFYMGVKTNMLYDVLMTPNMALEFYLGKGLSITAGGQYAWWTNDESAFSWCTYGADVEARYWFGKRAKEKPLTGHHIGLYAQMITYDFGLGSKGVMSSHWSWGVGATYGYVLPIHRVFNIDFAISFGYYQGMYEVYESIDGLYVWQSTNTLNMVGPTKAEVTLVWLIGRENYNRNKRIQKEKQIAKNLNLLSDDDFIVEDKGGEL